MKIPGVHDWPTPCNVKYMYVRSFLMIACYYGSYIPNFAQSPLLHFTIRDNVHESLGFSLNDFVFGHTVCGPLPLLKDECFQSEASVHALIYVAKNEI